MPDIVHVSPALFGSHGKWGGGERFALELAREQAVTQSVRLVVFGEERQRFRLDKLEIRVLPVRRRLYGHALNPMSEQLLLELGSAPVVHVHQYESTLTELVLLLGAALRRRVFVTDHGGVAPKRWRDVRLDPLVAGHLAVSTFAGRFYPEFRDRTTVIYGGADPSRFAPNHEPRQRAIVFVGRILPHKGIHDLILAVDPQMPLQIYGRPYDAAYRSRLIELAAGKDVRFITDAPDREVIRACQTARAVVLPSVHTSEYGEDAPKTELLGLTLVEAMACATPVICSNSGAMPEVVTDGVSGLVFAAGDVGALQDALRRVSADDRLWQALSRGAYERFRDQFTWTSVAARALRAYAATKMPVPLRRVPRKAAAQAAAVLCGISG